MPSKLRPSLPRSYPPLDLSLAIGAVLLLIALPRSLSSPVKSGYQRLVAPTQQAVSAAAGRGMKLVAGIGNALITGARLADAREQVQSLAEENRRLRGELALARATGTEPADAALATHTEPLVTARLIEARVLGEQSRAYLARRELVDRGSRAAVETRALVLDAPTLLDLGNDSGLTVGMMVLAGRRVCGMVADVGPWTSELARADSEGYRDVVEIVRQSGQRATQVTARGIWEGTGMALCRIRQVDASEPVSPGDLVIAATASVGGESLLYGRVARVELAAGGSLWDIWAEPALPRREHPHRVLIMSRQLNSARLAERPSRAATE